MPMKRSGRSRYGREAGDRDRRGVGADDGVRLQDKRYIRQYLALDLLALRGGLDDHIGVAEIRQGGGRRQPRDGGVAPRRVELSAVDGLLKVRRNIFDPGGNAFGAHVVQRDIQPGKRADLGDALAHLPRADNTDLANFENSWLRRPQRDFGPLYALQYSAALSPVKTAIS